MRDIKSILEGIVSQGRQVGSGGSSFRDMSSSNNKSGLNIGAGRVHDNERAAKEASADRAEKREDEVEKRNREAEQRQKETMKMAKEELQEELHPDYKLVKTGKKSTIAHPDGKPTYDIHHKGEKVATLEPFSAHKDTAIPGKRYVASRKDVTKYAIKSDAKGLQFNSRNRYHNNSKDAAEYFVQQHQHSLKEETMTEAKMVKKFVFDKPMKLDVAQHEKLDTEHLKDMHNRWTESHKKDMAMPKRAQGHDKRISDRLLAVHHVLKSRGVNVGELPKHPNLGMEHRQYNEETNLGEEIKGWKNAARDIRKFRSAASDAKKSAVLVSLKKDGSESGMHDAKSYHASEEEARKKHDTITKLNPNRKIRHNLYVDDKKVATLGEETNTEKREKIKNVARMDDAEPTSEKSTLSKTDQIKTKIVEEKPTMSVPNFGLPKSLIDAVRQIVEKKDEDDKDPKNMTGGKTAVDTDPETDDMQNEDDAAAKGKKSHTVPKTDKEKKLAALASPKDKITRKDVLVGRGVLNKEEVEQLDELKKSTLASYVKKAATKASHAGVAFGSAVDDNDPAAAETRKQSMHTVAKRTQGIAKAVDKLANEDFTPDEFARIEAIAAQLDEAKPTIVSAPIRGANQDQSGVGTKNSTADYTISDSKKMKVKEEADIDEAKGYKSQKELARKEASYKKFNSPSALTAKQKRIEAHMAAQKANNDAFKEKSVKEEVELEEGRGRPRKNPLPAGQAADVDDTHKHPMQQLEKISHSIEGREPHFEHKDESKTKVGRHLARHMVAIHNSMKTTQEKDDFANKLHANRDSMRSAVSKHF